MPVGLSNVMRVEERVLVQQPVLADAVEVEIGREVRERHLGLDPIVEPVAHVPGHHAPRAVFGAERADERGFDVSGFLEEKYRDRGRSP